MLLTFFKVQFVQISYRSFFQFQQTLINTCKPCHPPWKSFVTGLFGYFAAFLPILRKKRATHSSRIGIRSAHFSQKRLRGVCPARTIIHRRISIKRRRKGLISTRLDWPSTVLTSASYTRSIIRRKRFGREGGAVFQTHCPT